MSVSPYKSSSHRVSRCLYSKYNCSSVPFPSQSYCEKHMIENENSTFRQCSFIYPSTHERCTYAVLNQATNHGRESGLCREHFEEAEACRLKNKGKLLPPLETADTILCGISHYVKSSPFFIRRERLVGATADELLKQIERNKISVVDPLLDLDASQINARINETLNYPCEADSDIEPATTDTVWDNDDQDSSDPEDCDVEMNDPLRHANVFTEEEIILSARNHAVRIQNLCIQQHRRLVYLLREKKAKFLSELKKEKEIYGPLLRPQNMSIQEKKNYALLDSLIKYQKIGTGPENLLFRKMIDRRKAVTPGLSCRSSKNYNKCVFSEGGIRCTVRSIPSTKYCKKHILYDKNQILFQECGVQKKDHICKEPVISLSQLSCIFHSALPDPPKKPRLPKDECLDNSDTGIKQADLPIDKIQLEKDALEMLLNFPKHEPSCVVPNDFPSSFGVGELSNTRSSKPMETELYMKLPENLFDDISKSSTPFIDTLENMSMSSSNSQPTPSKPQSNDEDLELKSVVNEISNLLEMKEKEN